jgi:uncharacterized protein YjiS (DUF1127 family)
MQGERQALEDAKKIAELEIENMGLRAMAEVNAAKETESEDSNEKEPQGQSMAPLQISMPTNDQALMALAETVRTTQETMVAALQQNTQNIAQLQSLTVDAIEDMAEAVSAPRKITIQRDSKGRATGGTAVPVITHDEPESMQ